MSGSLTTAQRLTTILRKPGPYLTAYFDVVDTDLASQWDAVLPLIEHKRIPAHMREAVEARLGLPIGDDVGGWGIIVASDGSTEVFTSPDAPWRPIVNMAPVPYMAPALEWDQRDIPHVVVVADSAGIDVVPFVATTRPTVSKFEPASPKVGDLISEFVRDHSIELVVIGGEDEAVRQMSAQLRTDLPAAVLIRQLAQGETLGVDAFTEAVVRSVSTVHATRTVNALAEFRFEKSHGSAADGTTDVLKALREDDIRVLLVHDDPDDERVIALADSEDFTSIGSLTATGADPTIVRLVDAVIASALLSEAEVHIVPTTGRTGPTDDLGVIVSTEPRLDIEDAAALASPGADTVYVNSPHTNAAEHGASPLLDPDPTVGDEIVA